MNMKNIIIGVVVVAVAVAGYFMFKGDSGDSLSTGMPVPGTNTEETIVNQESGKKMAFSEFVKQGGAYKCTVNQNVGGTASVGTTYISNGMIRGEYNTKAQGLSIDTTLIVRDGFTYSWSSMAPSMGFKSKVVTGVVEDGSTNTSGTYSFNAEQIGDYDCEAWTVDASKFALPKGVTFREV